MTTKFRDIYDNLPKERRDKIEEKVQKDLENMEEDILIHYVVHKKEGSGRTDVKVLTQSIYSYVQTNPIYFKYEPDFYAGVLLFGIVGFKRDHNKLKKDLGKIFDRLNCQVQYIDGTIDKNHDAELKEIIKRFS